MARFLKHANIMVRLQSIITIKNSRINQWSYNFSLHMMDKSNKLEEMFTPNSFNKFAIPEHMLHRLFQSYVKQKRQETLRLIHFFLMLCFTEIILLIIFQTQILG